MRSNRFIQQILDSRLNLTTVATTPAGQVLKRALVFASALALPAILSGCVSQSLGSSLSGTIKNESPDRRVNDYSRVNCDSSIWQNQDDETNENSLYWLRLMSCVQSLTPPLARIQSYGYEVVKWDRAFKRAILLALNEPTSRERRKSLEQLNSFKDTYPDSVYPLIQLWSDQQTSELNLFDERLRTQRLKESNDAQLDALQQQHQDLKHQLSETTRKLENLTNIERQLSSRKMPQTELPHDESNSNAKSDAGPATPEELKKPVPDAVPVTNPVEDIKPDSPKPVTQPAISQPAATAPVPAKPDTPPQKQ
ncbi:two-component system QseEF-associated lipoprotein QseG [Budvicia diplopodorum]|uniref:two-component system QseEF-associated lipoprotein QseG n=1 Tax=Budvicia diplopodorum TaxID=1119056 RepID=UPI00135B26E5|nr:two-component system QseEF-associated lipoprotein QseG [Budvicia diplopodorum]